MISDKEFMAIIGFHDPMYCGDERLFLEAHGYEVKENYDLDSLKSSIKTHPKADFYSMDINLGKANTGFVEPAIEIYNLLKNRIDRDECKFYVLSANDDALENSVKAGIPKKHVVDKLMLGWSFEDMKNWVAPLEKK